MKRQFAVKLNTISQRGASEGPDSRIEGHEQAMGFITIRANGRGTERAMSTESKLHGRCSGAMAR